jgi:hypothetical protein
MLVGTTIAHDSDCSNGKNGCKCLRGRTVESFGNNLLCRKKQKSTKEKYEKIVEVRDKRSVIRT